jgi:hypothetical protein
MDLFGSFNLDDLNFEVDGSEFLRLEGELDAHEAWQISTPIESAAHIPIPEPDNFRTEPVACVIDADPLLSSQPVPSKRNRGPVDAKDAERQRLERTRERNRKAQARFRQKQKACFVVSLRSYFVSWPGAYPMGPSSDLHINVLRRTKGLFACLVTWFQSTIV